MDKAWQLTRLVEGVVEALLADDQDTVIQEFLEQVGTAELLSKMNREWLVEAIGEEFKPEDIFTLEDLDEWAQENGYSQEREDPPGYEERVRY